MTDISISPRDLVLTIPDWCPLETYNEVDPVVASSGRAQGIILDGMPGIEWAAENLTGHGGTEVNGNWYYTWQQAMAAAKELGDGWRLPTWEECDHLNKVSCAWDDKLYGRWFDDKLFLPANGYINIAENSLLAYLWEEGFYWGVFPCRAFMIYCQGKFFKDGRIIHLDFNSVHMGSSVRFVRQLKNYFFYGMQFTYLCRVSEKTRIGIDRFTAEQVDIFQRLHD